MTYISFPFSFFLMFLTLTDTAGAAAAAAGPASDPPVEPAAAGAPVERQFQQPEHEDDLKVSVNRDKAGKDKIILGLD